MLRISSKTTLQTLRDEGSIKFSQPERTIILYDSESIDQFLNRHVRTTFNQGRTGRRSITRIPTRF
ncbi:hypothetical protein LZG74_11520 [Dyadobacter sp. CY327]|nr:hypothetical protein [Dyadobacter sp. CY327]